MTNEQKIDIRKYSFVKNNHYLNLFFEMWEDYTDASLEFALLIWYALIGTVSSSFYTEGNEGERPNFYIFLLGPQFDAKKSTSIGVPQKILFRVNPDLIGAAQFTEEGFFKMLNQNKKLSEEEEKTKLFKEIPSSLIETNDFFPLQPFAIFNAEFSKFLKGINHKDYQAGLGQFITEVWDNIGPQVRLLSGQKLIINPYFNIFAASTIEYFQKAVDITDIFGGLLSRFLIYVNQDPPIKPKSAYDRKNITKHKNFPIIVDFLKTIYNHKKQTPITISPEAKKKYDEWENLGRIDNYKYTLNELPQGQKLQVRYPVFVRKFNLINCIVRGFETKSYDFSISEEDNQSSIDMITFIKDKNKNLLTNAISTEKIKVPLWQKIELTIKKSGYAGILREKLLQNLHLESWQLDKEILILLDNETVFLKPNYTSKKLSQAYIHKDFHNKEQQSDITI